MDTGLFIALLSMGGVIVGPVITYKWLGGKPRNSAEVRSSEAAATEHLVNTASMLMDRMKEQLQAAETARAAAEESERSAWLAAREARESAAEDRNWRELVEPVIPVEASWAVAVRDRLLGLLEGAGQGWPQDVRRVPPILAVVPDGRQRW